MTKRGLDIALSLGFLVLFAPLFAVVALLIRLFDGKPVVFWQVRVGKDGREFWFPKFRTMCPDAEGMHGSLLEHNDHPSSVTFKMKEDPRITPLGRTLRTLSLDELPQLWSVLKGDMSLVGPRPPLPGEVMQYSARERRRLEVRPGLTCLWQIAGRSLIPFDRQVALDIQYIETQSLWLDLKVLLLTIPAVFSCRGAC